MKYYRNAIAIFRELFNSLLVDIDFSENLSVPVKFEQQNLHWSHRQVTLHSGIAKTSSEKNYHVHLPDDRSHDQSFVHLALTNMINNAKAPDHSYIVTKSDNCKVQFKSFAHFWSIQELANKYAVPIILVFSIVKHGKGKADHVGLTKTIIRRAIVTGELSENATFMIGFLEQKYKGKTNPTYVLKEIDSKQLWLLRTEAKLKVFKTVLNAVV